jgi:hypothetical protein
MYLCEKRQEIEAIDGEGKWRDAEIQSEERPGESERAEDDGDQDLIRL